MNNSGVLRELSNQNKHLQVACMHVSAARCKCRRTPKVTANKNILKQTQTHEFLKVVCLACHQVEHSTSIARLCGGLTASKSIRNCNPIAKESQRTPLPLASRCPAASPLTFCFDCCTVNRQIGMSCSMPGA